jgi:hypothetical protein
VVPRRPAQPRRSALQTPWRSRARSVRSTSLVCDRYGRRLEPLCSAPSSGGYQSGLQDLPGGATYRI